MTVILRRIIFSGGWNLRRRRCTRIMGLSVPHRGGVPVAARCASWGQPRPNQQLPKIAAFVVGLISVLVVIGCALSLLDAYSGDHLARADL